MIINPRNPETLDHPPGRLVRVQVVRRLALPRLALSLSLRLRLLRLRSGAQRMHGFYSRAGRDPASPSLSEALHIPRPRLLNLRPGRFRVSRVHMC
jgi:hypothetical protein